MCFHILFFPDTFVLSPPVHISHILGSLHYSQGARLCNQRPFHAPCWSHVPDYKHTLIPAAHHSAPVVTILRVAVLPSITCLFSVFLSPLTTLSFLHHICIRLLGLFHPYGESIIPARNKHEALVYPLEHIMTLEPSSQCSSSISKSTGDFSDALSIRATCYAWPTYSTPQSTLHTAVSSFPS